MAFDFGKALQDGGTPEGITNYLKSQGREQEATGYFQNKLSPGGQYNPGGFNIPQNSSQAKSQVLGTFGKILREIPPTAGFFAGEALGGPPGAGIGAGAGEAVSQAGEKLLGIRKEFNPQDIALATGAGAVAGPFTGLGLTALRGVGKALAPVGRIALKGLQGVRGVLPGVSAETRSIIRGATPESLARIEQLSNQQSIPFNPVVEGAASAQKTIQQKAETDFGKSLDTVRASGKSVALQDNQLNTALNNATKPHGVSFTDQGKLDFTGTLNRIPDKSEQKILQSMVDDINRSKALSSTDELRALRARLTERANTLSPSVGKPTSEAYRMALSIKNSFTDALPKELQIANKLYKERSSLGSFIDRLIPHFSQDVFSPTALARVKQLGKEEVGALFKNPLAAIKKETGIDLESMARELNAAKEINPSLIVQDVGGITRGIQKAANPIAGQYNIERTKLFQSPVGQKTISARKAIANILPSKEFVKNAGKQGLKLGTFELFKNRQNE